MKRFNYNYSEYHQIQSGLIEDVIESHEYAAFLHHADMLKYRMAELEAAGMLDDDMAIQAFNALQRSQYTNSFAIVWFHIDRMDSMLEQLPTYTAPKPSRLARFFAGI